MRAWLGTVARLLLAAVWLTAGAAEVGDLAGSGWAVHAYQLTPYEVSTAIGAALPFVEVALGGLLLVGLGTRVAAAVSAGLLVVFAAGVVSAWARGLAIDCGCFGGGGELAAGAEPGCGLEIARSAGLAVVSAGLFLGPLRSCRSMPGCWVSARVSRRGDEQVTQASDRSAPAAPEPMGRGGGVGAGRAGGLGRLPEPARWRLPDSGSRHR